MCMMFHRLVPCPGLNPKWCVFVSVSVSLGLGSYSLIPTCTNCNTRTRHPVVRTKTNSGISYMGHHPWCIFHGASSIAIHMRQYLSLVLVLLLSPFAICQCRIVPCRLFADPHSKCRGMHRSWYCCSKAGSRD